MRRDNLPPAVVLGMTATGLSAARSLGRKGIKVYGLDSDSREAGMFSRYARPIVMPNVIEREREFISYLVEFGKRLPQPGILLCTSDEYLIAVSKNRETLSSHFKFNIPSRETVENFSDKRKSYSIAREYSIPCPATYCTDDIEEVKVIAKRIQYPCALKPALSHLWRIKHGGKKLIVVNSPEELIASFSEVAKECPGIMIQELIPGRDDQIRTFYGYFNGSRELLALCLKRKLRQHPIHFGISSFCVSEDNDSVKTMGLGFLTKIKYTGFGGMEFKQDARDGKFKFTELNMRFVMPEEVLVASGVDFSYIMYRDLIGEKVEKVITFKEGVKLVNLELDLGSFWQYLKAKEITVGQYIRSFIGGKVVHTYFAWDDLGPGIFVMCRFIRSLFKKCLSGLAHTFEIWWTKIKEVYSRFRSPVRETAKWGYSFIPLRLRNGNRFFKELEFLNRSQYWSRQELENYQNEKLRDLITHAYRNVPYYNQLFKEHNLSPADIRTVRDLPKIPILTKDIVRVHYKKMIAKNIAGRQLKLLFTSGTTGKPLRYYTDRRNEYMTGAPVQWRYFEWGGRSDCDDMAVFGEQNLRPHFSGQRRLFEYNPINRHLLMSINDLNAGNIGEYVNAIERHNLMFFKAFPSAMELFIRLLKIKNIKPGFKIRTVFTNSESMFPWQRDFIKDYFRCEVLDWYGMEERVIVATECDRHSGHHISSEYGIVEFRRDLIRVPAGEKSGAIVATGLTNFGMPIIRYRTGDIGYPVDEECPCGRTLPLMVLQSGRERDFAIGKKRNLIPLTMIDIGNATDSVWQFQFIQDSTGSLHLDLIRKDNFTNSDLGKIKAKLDEKFGDTMDVQIRFKESMESTGNGKVPLFIQRMRVEDHIPTTGLKNQ